MVIAPQNWMREIADEIDRRGFAQEMIICLSISVQDAAWIEIEQHPSWPIISYHWDEYSWMKDDWRWKHYDGNKWARLMEMSKVVLVPSEAEKTRYRASYGLLGDVRVVWSYIKTDHLPDRTPTNNGFILDPVRDLPDSNNRLAEKACKELGIEYINPQQKMDWDAYSKALATCSAIVSTNKEMSTGSLGLIEALWYGRPAIVYAESTNAAAEYLGPFAQFLFKDFAGLREQIRYLTANDHQFDVEETRSWIRENYSLKSMVDGIESACSRI